MSPENQSGPVSIVNRMSNHATSQTTTPTPSKISARAATAQPISLVSTLV